MEITLEKIELVKDRTGVSYKEAKEALEKTEGDVVNAIILIEESVDNGSGESDSAIKSILNSIKELIKKGNVSKVVIKKNDEIILNIPVNVGIVGTVAFPWAAVTSVIAAFGTKCKIVIVKVDGELIDVSAKAEDAASVAKQKGGVIVDEVKDKGSDAFDFAKEKGKVVWDAAKDAGQSAWDVAKEKATEVYHKVKKDEGEIAVNDFDDLDLTDVDFSELEDRDE